MSASGPGFQNLIGQINASRQKQGMAPMPPATQPSNRFINKRTRPIQPGGPFVPRPDLGPGVGFGVGLPGGRPFVPKSGYVPGLPPATQPIMQPPATQPIMQPPMTGGPDPIPPMTQPGGPFVPRPDLGPGVGYGVGLPQPMPNPEQSTFTQQINQGVSPIANAVGQPGYPMSVGGKSMPGGVGIGFGAQAPIGQETNPQYQYYANYQGPGSAGFNPGLGNTTLPGNF